MSKINLKRSISPDGRIDALTIEAEDVPREEVAEWLGILNGLAAGFKSITAPATRVEAASTASASSSAATFAAKKATVKSVEEKIPGHARTPLVVRFDNGDSLTTFDKKIYDEINQVVQYGTEVKTLKNGAPVTNIKWFRREQENF